jgi:2'-5' RNA ligase
MPRYYVGHLIKGDAAEYYKHITADLAERFGVKNLSEKAPPHFTFKAPFESSNIEEFEQKLGDVASRQKPAPLSIEGFGRMGKTVFLAIKPDPELQKQANEIALALSQFGQSRRSVPIPLRFHVSVARFLKPKQLREIWDYVQTLPKPQFDVTFDGLALFVFVGRRWEIQSTWPFKNNDA